MNAAHSLNITTGFALILLAGCGQKDCAKVANADDRDWCYHEVVVQEAKANHLDLSLTALGQIQAPMVRAFAIQELMVADPKGMHKEQAEALCRTLPTNQVESCLRTWSRPHLWSQ